MVRAADMFDAEQIVYAVRSQLTWTHLRELTAIDEPLKRRFYMEMCRLERWSTRALKDKIGGLLYERTALAKKPEAVISKALDDVQEGDRLTPDLVFRDPYVLDFLRLPADYAEADLEAAILRHIEQGSGKKRVEPPRAWDRPARASAPTGRKEGAPRGASTKRPRTQAALVG